MNLTTILETKVSLLYEQSRGGGLYLENVKHLNIINSSIKNAMAYLEGGGIFMNNILNLNFN